MDRQYHLTDAQFALVASLLEGVSRRRVAPGDIDDRQALEAVLGALCAGSHWQDIPRVCGPAVARRYAVWSEEGVLWPVFMRLRRARALCVHLVLRQGDGPARVPLYSPQRLPQPPTEYPADPSLEALFGGADCID